MERERVMVLLDGMVSKTRILKLRMDCYHINNNWQISAFFLKYIVVKVGEFSEPEFELISRRYTWKGI